MLDVEITTEKLFTWYVSVGIKCVESVVFQFEVKLVTENIVSADMCNAEISFKYLLVFFIFTIGRVDSIGHCLAFLGTFLQFASQLNAYFIRFAVGVYQRIDNVDHLVENLLYDGVAKTVF